MSLRLYFHPLSSFCHKALIGLYEAGTEFEREVVNPGDPESRAMFEAVWPLAKFPVLKDEARGVEGTFMWLMEEVGELAAALRDGSPHAELAKEFADVLAWLTTIANVAGVDLEDAIRLKYGSGCPGCGQLVCTCSPTEKP